MSHSRLEPEQQKMHHNPCPEQSDLLPQPKVPGNGCLCRCCGAPPGDIKINDIKKHGNTHARWIQKPDGRIIEYYVYGSTSPDARILIQINGSLGSAKFFSEMPTMVNILKAKNVKAISINIPGHGFTSVDPLRKIGDWAKSDVDPVLQAEKVPEDAPLMVEGTSDGSSHCHCVMWYYQKRVTAVHLHVPVLSAEVAKELNLKVASEGCSCDGKYITNCFVIPGNWTSPLLFCCCYTCAPLIPPQADGIKKMEGYKDIKGFEASDVMKNHSMKHCFAHSVHGIVYNSLLGQLYNSFNFNPFKDIDPCLVEKMKIQVSYGEKDPSSPESHGIYMAEYYSKLCNADGKMWENVEANEVVGNGKGGKCLVLHRPGGHEAHFIAFFKGELLRKFMELSE